MHAVVGGFTPGNTSFSVMNPDFHFVLAMDVIVCNAVEGNVLRTSVYTIPTVLKAEVLWSRLEFIMMLTLSSKLFNFFLLRENCMYHTSWWRSLKLKFVVYVF